MLQEYIAVQAYSQDYEKGKLHGCMMCMYSAKLGVCRACSCRKLGALRSILRPFLDRSKAVVPTWSTVYCNPVLAAMRRAHMDICLHASCMSLKKHLLEPQKNGGPDYV